MTNERSVQLKTDLFMSLQAVVAGRKLTKKDLQQILETSQPRISDLMRGKLGKFSVEKLIEYLGALGAETSFNIKYNGASFRIKPKAGA